MNELDERVDRWSRDVDGKLPAICPKCMKELDKIRYSFNRDEVRVHLTGAGYDFYYFLAQCPYCDNVLKKEGNGDVKERLG